MKNKFTKKIAKEIAQNQLDWTLDCILGIQDPDWNLETDISKFEDNFTEDLEEMNISATPARIKIINEYYQKLVDKAYKVINKLYSKKNSKKED